MSEWRAWTLCSEFPLHKYFGKRLFIYAFKKSIVSKFHEARIGFMGLMKEQLIIQIFICLLINQINPLLLVNSKKNSVFDLS